MDNETLFSVHITKYLGIILKASAAKIGWGTKSLDLLFDYAGISQPRTRTKDGRLIADGDPLTHQVDLPMEQGGGAFVLSCAAVKHICTELLNRLNAFAWENELRVMTDIRGRTGTGLSTPFRMRR